MKFEELCQVVPPNGVFRIGHILAGQRSPEDVRRQIGRWSESGKILQIRRGVYVLASPYGKVSPHPFAIANSCRRSSYVSLESALSNYGMIPEYVPATTSITTGRPEELPTPFGRMIFKHVSQGRFFGFRETDLNRDQSALLASPSKAVVDLLYLTPRSDDEAYLSELRLEPMEDFDIDNLRETATGMKSKKVLRAVERLIGIWKEEELL